PATVPMQCRRCYDYPSRDSAYSGGHCLRAARWVDFPSTNPIQCGSLPAEGDLLFGREDREEDRDRATGGDVVPRGIDSCRRFRGEEPAIISAELHREGGADRCA